MQKEFFDILVVTPLDEEAEELFKHFHAKQDRTEQDYLIYEIVAENAPQLRILMIKPQQMGRNPAFEAVLVALTSYSFGLIVGLGIGGRVSSDLRLGDVCYTGGISDVYERQKISDAPGGKGVTIEFSPDNYKTPRTLTAAVNFFCCNPALKPALGKWQSQSNARLKELFKEDNSLRNDPRYFKPAPGAYSGNIACAAVSTSDIYNAALKDVDRKFLAIETESGGIFQAAQDKDVPAITFRGISDYADSKKNKLEEQFKGAGRKIAIHNVVTFFKAQLENQFFLKFIVQRQSCRDGAQQPSLFPQVQTSTPLEKALDRLATEFDAKLHELCPECRLQQKGYHLPTPRVQPLLEEDGSEDPEKQDYYDIVDVVRDHRMVLIDIPLSYPDQGFPWVVASELQTLTFGNRQVVPYVIDGEMIRPPKSDLERALPNEELLEVYTAPGSQVVFVVPNIPFKSATRQGFLTDEINKYPDAKFLFVTRGSSGLLIDNEFVRSTGARLFGLRNVSFVAIAQFIEQSFKMPANEAEVVALKLQDIFRRFDLSAHPTYFAGIPKETLSALLQANRRAELIELAVVGFLTFVVADDPEDVSLSRTTRAQYLSLLAVELDVEKRTFTQEALVKFTKDFAAKYDFDVDALKFISAFVDKGILRFVDDSVQFTLPFIRAYLLARQLAEQPALAKKYFAFGSDDFDMEAFDIYAELGASEEIVSDVMLRIRGHVDKSGIVNDPILLSNKLQPAIMTKIDRFNKLRDGIHRTITKLQDTDGDGQRKQRLLDIADKVSREAGKRAGKKESDEDKMDAEWQPAIRDWITGSVLLGSAAERLTAETKRDLVSALIDLGAVLIEKLTARSSEVDFKKLKETILKSEEVGELVSSFSDAKEREDICTQIGHLIDFVELAFLARPFRGVLGHLCDYSGHRVLAKSVEQSTITALFPQILHALWLTDLDTKKGASGLRKLLAELPSSPFLRIVLVHHLLARVYWNKWEKKDREALLDIAAETIESMGLNISKGEILRRMDEISPTGLPH